MSEDKLKTQFWDIESYNNFFCVGMMNQDRHIEMHYLVNNDEDKAKVIKALEHYTTIIDKNSSYTAYDLSKDASRLVWHFKKDLSKEKAEKPPMINAFLSQDNIKKQLEGTGDTVQSPNTNKEYWYFGYNTLNYDIPMIDHLLKFVVGGRLNTTPKSLRSYSDKLINREINTYNAISYAKYANQVDCVHLNEHMMEKGRPKVGLKTLVGIRGGSIIESESNTSGVSDDIYQDTLYNINDVTELKDVVFPGFMEEAFNTRKYLMDHYPKLASLGLTVNSTSAQFVENIVAPDKPIVDDPVVSYQYPAPHIVEEAKKNGHPNAHQINILEDTYQWYMTHVYQVVKKNNPKAANDNLAKFLSVYEFYKSIEGENWNESERHFKRYGIKAHTKAERHELFNKFGTFLPLIDKYGNNTGTYVNFSLGGLHGAEVHNPQLEQDRAKIKQLREKYKYVSKIPSKAASAKLRNLIAEQSRTPYQGYSQHLLHEIPYLYHQTEKSDEILPPEEFTPFMYKESGKKYPSEELIDRYKYTSIGDSVHQDFTSYYPTLIINLGIFYDGNGRDRYHEIYNHRVAIKKKLKTLEFGTPEYEKTDIEQLGYKLVLNSASGILDGSFDTKLRANNKALEMRVDGQLATFRIAAALALEGAHVPSTNTDGIYVFDMPIEENDQIVKHTLDGLFLGIEPEPVYIVSKDANNRMEVTDGEITSARGGTLTSWGGARVDNSLSHPALSDRIMTYYLERTNKAGLSGIVNKDLLRQCIQDYVKDPPLVDEFKDYPDAKMRTIVYMASWVIRSTSGSIMIDRGTMDVYPGTQRGWLYKSGLTLERFAARKMKPSKSLNIFAGVKGNLSDKVLAKNQELFGKLPANSKLGNPQTIDYLNQCGVLDKYFTNAITVGQYRQNVANGDLTSQPVIGQTKIAGLPEGALVHIDNHSLLTMSHDKIKEIYNNLDWNQYVEMIASFAEVWQNPVVKS